jgi:DNA-directed RNA polymerase specialized sigma54-like protein
LESYRPSPLNRGTNAILKDSDNQKLSSEEAQTVQSMLKEAEELLQQIENNARVINRIIETLESHQNAIASHLSKHQALVAPINNLPFELLFGT